MWPDQANGVPADLKYRFNWTMPFAISPHDHNKIYVGSQHVHQYDQRRPELAGDQPRPHAQRQDAASRSPAG